MIIGIDIGGTKCQVIQADDHGEILHTARFATTTCEETLAVIFDKIAELVPPADTRYGIACGGPLDSAKGLILSPPNLPGWDAIPICEMVTRRFGGRATLMNDANAAALAEWKFGAGRGTKNMIFLTHATGMGAGLILDGRLYEGTTGDAGEVGHIRLAPEGPVGYHKAGSFEGFCSGSGLAKLARQRQIPGFPENGTAKELAALAEKGIPEALQVFEESGRRLGQGLSLLIDLLNPQVIVLGSVYCRSGQYLEKAMREVLEQESLSTALHACKILPAQLGERLGEIQTIAAALYAFPNP